MELIFIIIGLILAIIITALSVYSYGCYKDGEKRKTAISFKESLDLTDLPVVSFVLKGGDKLNFLLDTGATISYIGRSIVKKHKLPIKDGNGFHVTGMEGNSKDADFCTIELLYKGKTFSEEFGVLDLSKSFAVIKKESGVTIHGILGNSFFTKYQYIIDFKDLIAYSKKK